MARFQYRMQSILNITVQMETQAKMDFAIAQKELLSEEEKQEQLKSRKRAYEEQAEALLKKALNLPKIKENKEAVKVMEAYIAEQAEKIRIAEKRVEKARQKLVDVMQERQMHEKLREKAFEVFMQEEKARESKEIDQLTSYTYGQKQLEEQD